MQIINQEKKSLATITKLIWNSQGNGMNWIIFYVGTGTNFWFLDRTLIPRDLTALVHIIIAI